MAKNKRGGRRAGAGRKRAALPPEILAELGEVPIGKPMQLARWFTNAIALLTREVLAGKPYAKLLEMVRASAGAAGRVIPHDIVFAAQARLKDDARELLTAAGGQVVTRESAPIAKGGKPVRRDPSV